MVISPSKKAVVRDLRQRRWLWGRVRTQVRRGGKVGEKVDMHAVAGETRKLSGCLDMIPKLYCLTSRSYIAPGNKTSSQTHRKQRCLYLSTAKSRRSQQQQVAIPRKKHTNKCKISFVGRSQEGCSHPRLDEKNRNTKQSITLQS